MPKIAVRRLMILVALVAVLFASYRSEYAAIYFILACFFAMAGVFIVVAILVVDRLVQLWDHLTQKPNPPLSPDLPAISKPTIEFPEWLTLGRRVRMPNGVVCEVSRVYEPSGSPSAVFEVVGDSDEYYRLEFGRAITKVTPDPQPNVLGRIVEWMEWELEELVVLD